MALTRMKSSDINRSYTLSRFHNLRLAARSDLEGSQIIDKNPLVGDAQAQQIVFLGCWLTFEDALARE